MKQVRTNDSSYTLLSEKYNETYHSNTGAIEEATKKFVEPADIKPGMQILDICFGLGYNSGAALHKTKKLKIIGLENDLGVLNEVGKIRIPYWFEGPYRMIRNAAKEHSYRDGETEIQILLGDARNSIKNILTTKEENKFDVVFLDPFSPPKCPELWEVGFLKEVRRKMKVGGVLTTYSCASEVRRNLAEAGFKVRDGPCVGRRSPSTIAVNM